MRRRDHKCSLCVKLGKKRCRSLAAQTESQICCPYWISEAWFLFLFALWVLFPFFCLVSFFRGRVSLNIPGQSGTHYIHQASLHFEICLCLLGLKAYASMPAQRPVFQATTLRHQRWTGHVKFKLSNVALPSILTTKDGNSFPTTNTQVHLQVIDSLISLLPLSFVFPSPDSWSHMISDPRCVPALPCWTLYCINSVTPALKSWEWAEVVVRSGPDNVEAAFMLFPRQPFSAFWGNFILEFLMI